MTLSQTLLLLLLLLELLLFRLPLFKRFDEEQLKFSFHVAFCG